MRTLRLAATLVVLAAVGGFAATDASGAPITFAYAGVITSVTTPGSPIAAGDRFMVTFTFEGETGPSRSLPNIADYPAVLSASLLVTRGADVVFAWSPPITWSNIEVLNDYQLTYGLPGRRVQHRYLLIGRRRLGLRRLVHGSR